MSVSRKPSPNPLTILSPEEALLKRPLHRVAGAKAIGAVRRLAPRENIHRMLRGAPEVTVKVAKFRSGRTQVRQLVRYLSRDWEQDLVGPDGRGLDESDQKQLVDDLTAWHKEGLRDAMHVIVSMPEGTSREAVARAAETWAGGEFPERLHIVAHHSDQEHPHAHVVVAMVGPDGKRLRPDRETLQGWRESFARALEDRHIEAAATPRDVRGRWEKAQRSAERQMQDRGVVPDVVAARAADIDRPAPEKPWRAAQIKRHDLIKEALEKLAAQAPDPDKADALRVHAEGLPPPRDYRDRLREIRAKRLEREREQELER